MTGLGPSSHKEGAVTLEDWPTSLDAQLKLEMFPMLNSYKTPVWDSSYKVYYWWLIHLYCIPCPTENSRVQLDLNIWVMVKVNISS